MILARRRNGATDLDKRLLAVSLDALGIGTIERKTGEELRRHATATTGIEEVATGACSCALW